MEDCVTEDEMMKMMASSVYLINEGEEKGERNQGKAERGFMNKLISSFLHPSETETETEADGDSVAGIIKNNPPPNLPVLPFPADDDAVPAIDEASIMIHSIIHD